MQTGLLEPLVPPTPLFDATAAWAFEVRGDPEPQGSWVAFVDKFGHARAIPANKPKLNRWRKLVEAQAREQMPEGFEIYDQPLLVALTFVRQRSPDDYLKDGHTLRKGAPRYPATAPDVDKLTRAVLDALTDVAFVNDSRVVSCPATKRFAEIGEPPGVEVTIVPL